MTQDALQLHGLIAPGTPPEQDAPSHHHVPCGPITALVSQVADLAAVADQSPDGLARSAMAHHAILSAYSDTPGVLPFRFGTAFRTAQSLKTALLQGCDRYVAALSDVAKLREYTLRIGRADNPSMTQTVAAANGRAHLAARLHRRQQRDSVAARRKTFAEQLLRDIAGLTIQMTPAQRTTPEDATRQVLLLYKDAVNLLRDRLDVSADEAAALGLTLDLNGPWPPYSYDIDAPPQTRVRHAS